jgi:hypothetical protein
MIEKLKQVNWVLFVLVVLGLRAVYSADMAQALVVIAFSAVYSFKTYMNSVASKPLETDVKNQLEEMKTTISGLAMKNAVKPQAMQQELAKRFF